VWQSTSTHSGGQWHPCRRPLYDPTPLGSATGQVVERDHEETMENKRAHLEMIQSVVARMAANSFHLKGWSVALVSALFALAAGGANSRYIYLAYFPAAAFWILDGYFLWQERLFRGLYDKVRGLDEAQIDFSMSTSGLDGGSWLAATFSKTLGIFHGAVFGSIVVVMLVVLASTN
jgi:hypothetical protein